VWLDGEGSVAARPASRCRPTRRSAIGSRRPRSVLHEHHPLRAAHGRGFAKGIGPTASRSHRERPRSVLSHSNVCGDLRELVCRSVTIASAQSMTPVSGRRRRTHASRPGRRARRPVERPERAEKKSSTCATNAAERAPLRAAVTSRSGQSASVGCPRETARDAPDQPAQLAATSGADRRRSAPRRRGDRVRTRYGTTHPDRREPAPARSGRRISGSVRAARTPRIRPRL